MKKGDLVVLEDHTDIKDGKYNTTEKVGLYLKDGAGRYRGFILVLSGGLNIFWPKYQCEKLNNAA